MHTHAGSSVPTAAHAKCMNWCMRLGSSTRPQCGLLYLPKCFALTAKMQTPGLAARRCELERGSLVLGRRAPAQATACAIAAQHQPAWHPKRMHALCRAEACVIRCRQQRGSATPSPARPGRAQLSPSATTAAAFAGRTAGSACRAAAATAAVQGLASADGSCQRHCRRGEAAQSDEARGVQRHNHAAGAGCSRRARRWPGKLQHL